MQMPAGFVGYDPDGHFVHVCKCGKDAGHGFGVELRRDKPGLWFCDQHKPETVPKDTRALMQYMVTLSDHWIGIATEAGIARHNDALAHDYKHYGVAPASAAFNITGCICECAVAKFLGKPWKPNVGNIRADDVVGGVESRGTRNRKYMALPIRPNDKDHPPTVRGLLIGSNMVQLIGWLYGHEAKHGKDSDLWDEQQGCWHNPVSTLRSMTDLLEMVSSDGVQHGEDA